MEVEFLILDEPTANLDVKSKEEFINILKLLNEKGVTILITSHIIEELQQIIDHLVIINNKKIVYDNAFDREKEVIQKNYNSVVEKKQKNLDNLKKIF